MTFGRINAQRETEKYSRITPQGSGSSTGKPDFREK
jgi:hypothetical protein